ncbi:3-oxoacyl-[acyl-carrier-protein] synthase-3 [Maridesulfovibrio ferrireducens]|uniref:3-oxoacyl-[acyl-carrier-protein] synthase-3 n=1 Tax=Maridesulfovibrio ferrireducens TaxID=246191 RepID=A0A1G9CKR3_9BACT|nr:ketoacyl-ACP synthase III [Maridesulfovibrio ferrireducens]SDK52025.1 3-oxoacyl-[acyl-carrier-protein] synthase-3 [Maridesulfovibrio ferrireducens]
MTALINTIEYYIPKNTVDCFELDKSKPEWHVRNSLPKTGVRFLHHADKDETTLQMARNAAEKAIKDLTESDLPDTLIVCTQTPDNLLPHVSACLQHELGLPSSTKCFDISLGCSGYCYGLSTAYAYLTANISKRVLFVTVDNYSKIIDSDTNKAYLLFSDGASATIIDKPEVSPVFQFGTDGSRNQSIVCSNSGVSVTTGKDPETPIPSPEFQMDGYKVLQFTIKTIPPEIIKLTESAGVSLEDIDLFIFHQASRRVLEEMGKKLAIPEEKLIIDLEEVGNITSSSIPIAMKRAEERGVLKRGNKVLLFGFGIGLSWSGAIIEY